LHTSLVLIMGGGFTAVVIFAIAGAWIPVMHRCAWLFCRPGLSANEHVEFFPSHGLRPDPTENPRLWEVQIGGVVYEKHWGEEALINTIVKTALYFQASDEQGKLLAKRIGFFTRDFNRGKQLQVKFQGCGKVKRDKIWSTPSNSTSDCGHISNEEWILTAPSQEDGTFWGILRFESSLLQPGDFVTFSTTSGGLDKEESQQFFSEARLIGNGGIGVISDIDDTIRETGVGNVTQVLSSTFLEPFEEVEGMAAVYRRWSEEALKMDRTNPMSVHFVSGSPWPLQKELKSWLWGKTSKEIFPYGSFHLKSIRFELLEPWGIDGSILRLVSSPLDFKLTNARSVLDRHFERKFILVGDAGEKDPEIYGQLYREHPDQILCIIIREVGTNSMDGVRREEAFYGVPAERWKTIQHSSELEDQTIKVIGSKMRC